MKFCSECGTPIERFEKKVIETKNSIDPYDFCNEYLGNHDERVCSDNGGLPNNIWLWNYSLPTNLKKYEIKSDELDINNNIALDLSEVDIEKAVKEFLQIDKVNELIEKFESVYGKNSIKVKYGIVCPIY